MCAGEAHAQQYEGFIALGQIPSKIGTGDTITFSGQLLADDGSPVYGATVYIKDDVDFGSDDVIKTLVTGSDGRFAGTWAAQPRSSGAWDFYAVYEGGSQVGKARSATYSVQVSSYYDSEPAGSSRSGPTHYQTAITLDVVPAWAYAGDSVTFTGGLTAHGQPLRDAPVGIYEDDPLSPDQRLGYGATDWEGRFSITWSVEAGLVETDFDIYAKFNGDSVYEGSRTPNQTVGILKNGGYIELDQIQDSARVGETVTFSGTLQIDGYSSEGAVVYIKDEDPLTGDDLLATGYVGADGRFSANWFADYSDPDDTVDVYAVFEGDKNFHRLTTCDNGPTSSIGGLCRYTIPLTIYGSLPATPPSGYVFSGDEYMKFFYALDFYRNPHVAIVPNPDAYNEVRGHVIPVKEGVLMWQSYMEGRYGGDWSVTFEVVEPGKAFYDSAPDIVMNLDTYDTHAQCYADYYGVALIYPDPQRPVQTTVCSTEGGQRRSDVDVSATAAHEFIHAMGLGHAFNKSGDMMCSVEDGAPTCDGSSKSKIPSAFNLAALAQMYGDDGFKNPNRHVAYDERFPDAGTFGGPGAAPEPASQCLRDDGDQDMYELMESGEYMWIAVCREGPVHYYFSTDHEYDVYEIYVLPPETDVVEFINGEVASYDVCGEAGQVYHEHYNVCDMEPGSNILLYNATSEAMWIYGHISSHE